MYHIKNNMVLPVPFKDILNCTPLDAANILKIESIAAQAYSTTVHELNVFYKDTEAKIICCFLLQHLLNYSTRQLADRYKINRLFLANQIKERYIKCLQDPGFMDHIDALKMNFRNNLQPTANTI